MTYYISLPLIYYFFCLPYLECKPHKGGERRSCSTSTFSVPRTEPGLFKKKCGYSINTCLMIIITRAPRDRPLRALPGTKASGFQASFKGPARGCAPGLGSPVLSWNEPFLPSLLYSHTPPPDRLGNHSSRLLEEAPVETPRAGRKKNKTRQPDLLYSPADPPGRPSRRAPAPGPQSKARWSDPARGGPEHLLREPPSPMRE